MSPRPKVRRQPGSPKAAANLRARPKSQWMKNFHFTQPDKAALSAIPASHRRENPLGRPGKSGPAIVAFTVFKASAREFHQSNLCQKSKTLGGYPAGPG